MPPLTVWTPYGPYHLFHHHHRLNTTLTQLCIPKMLHLICSRFFRLICSRPYPLGSIATVNREEVSKGEMVLMRVYIEKWKIESIAICFCSFCFLPLCLTSFMIHIQQVHGNIVCKVFDLDIDFSIQHFYSSVLSSILRGGWLVRILVHILLFVFVLKSDFSCLRSMLNIWIVWGAVTFDNFGRRRELFF